MPISNPLLTITRPTYQNLAPKRVVSRVIPVLNPNEAFSGTMPLGKSFVLFKASTSHPARVRVYSRASYRNQDLPRILGTDVSGESGLILEVATVAANLELDLSPLVWGGNLEVEQTENIPISVINLGSIAQAITVNFMLITAEF
jgi:hypothetical protein